MAIVKCGECGAGISSAASMCPQCGKKRGSSIRWVLGIFVLFLVVRCSMIETPPPAPDTRTPEQIAEAKARDKADTERTVKAGIVLQSIKVAMRDPASVTWSTIRSNEDGSVVCVEYRARNGFGGMNLEYATYSGGKISTKPAAWNKHCTDDLYDMSKAAHLIK